MSLSSGWFFRPPLQASLGSVATHGFYLANDHRLVSERPHGFDFYNVLSWFLFPDMCYHTTDEQQSVWPVGLGEGK